MVEVVISISMQCWWLHPPRFFGNQPRGTTGSPNGDFGESPPKAVQHRPSTKHMLSCVIWVHMCTCKNCSAVLAKIYIIYLVAINNDPIMEIDSYPKSSPMNCSYIDVVESLALLKSPCFSKTGPASRPMRTDRRSPNPGWNRFRAIKQEWDNDDKPMEF